MKWKISRFYQDLKYETIMDDIFVEIYKYT